MMRRLAVACGLFVGLMSPGVVEAQRSDSTRAGVSPSPQQAVVRRDSMPSPRRAFLTSLIAPGSMQLRFKRPKAAAIFFLAEAGAVGMSLKSWNSLSKAKDARADTVGTPALDTSGQPVIDPQTGLPVINYAPRNPNLADRVRARRSQLEDWIAVVVFNHLFAGADAFVAANLADFDANVQVSATDRRMGVLARLSW